LPKNAYAYSSSSSLSITTGSSTGHDQLASGGTYTGVVGGGGDGAAHVCGGG
jgi:hypothetical protein